MSWRWERAMDCEGMENSGEKEMEDRRKFKQLATKKSSISCLPWISQHWGMFQCFLPLLQKSNHDFLLILGGEKFSLLSLSWYWLNTTPRISNSEKSCTSKCPYLFQYNCYNTICVTGHQDWQMDKYSSVGDWASSPVWHAEKL